MDSTLLYDYIEKLVKINSQLSPKMPNVKRFLNNSTSGLFNLKEMLIKKTLKMHSVPLCLVLIAITKIIDDHQGIRFKKYRLV